MSCASGGAAKDFEHTYYLIKESSSVQLGKLYRGVAAIYLKNIVVCRAQQALCRACSIHARSG